MDTTKYRDRDGNPIDLQTWSARWEDLSYRWVLRTCVQQLEVRTVWEGIEGRPLFHVGLSSDGGASWLDAGHANTEADARALHAQTLNLHLTAEDPWYRHVLADGTVWVDIKRTRDGRVMCEICHAYIPADQLAVQDGHPTDLCVPCTDSERQEAAAATAYWESLPESADRPASWQQAWAQALPEVRVRYRALVAATPKDERHA